MGRRRTHDFGGNFVVDRVYAAASHIESENRRNGPFSGVSCEGLVCCTGGRRDRPRNINCSRSSQSDFRCYRGPRPIRRGVFRWSCGARRSRSPRYSWNVFPNAQPVVTRTSHDGAEQRSAIHILHERTEVFVAPASRRHFCTVPRPGKLPARRRSYNTTSFGSCPPTS
jgi:hypothetical protein